MVRVAKNIWMGGSRFKKETNAQSHFENARWHVSANR